MLFQKNTTVCCLTIAALVLLLTSVSRGDGLIYQLPPDGTWVKLAGCGRHWGHERIPPPEAVGKDDEVAAMPNEEYSRGAVILQSVGAVEIDGEKCRWIELKTDIPKDMKDPPDPEIWKMLIPERHLKEGSDPFAHIKKMYIKAGFAKDGLERVDTDKKLLAYEIERIRKWFPAVPKESKRQKDDFIRVDGRDVRGESLRFDSYFEGKLHLRPPFDPDCPT